MAERSSHQQKIIRNFYNNRDAIAVQRLQELITELYLSEGKKRKQHWKHIRTHLAKLEVKEAQIDHLEKQDDPEVVAKFISKFIK